MRANRSAGALALATGVAVVGIALGAAGCGKVSLRVVGRPEADVWLGRAGVSAGSGALVPVGRTAPDLLEGGDCAIEVPVPPESRSERTLVVVRSPEGTWGYWVDTTPTGLASKTVILFYPPRLRATPSPPAAREQEQQQHQEDST